MRKIVVCCLLGSWDEGWQTVGGFVMNVWQYLRLCQHLSILCLWSGCVGVCVCSFPCFVYLATCMCWWVRGFSFLCQSICSSLFLLKQSSTFTIWYRRPVSPTGEQPLHKHFKTLVNYIKTRAYLTWSEWSYRQLCFIIIPCASCPDNQNLKTYYHL